MHNPVLSVQFVPQKEFEAIEMEMHRRNQVQCYTLSVQIAPPEPFKAFEVGVITYRTSHSKARSTTRSVSTGLWHSIGAYASEYRTSRSKARRQIAELTLNCRWSVLSKLRSAAEGAVVPPYLSTGHRVGNA
eukprot:3208728-Rhodomonas_salina.2